MPNSNRWEPFIDGKRCCQECKEIKEKNKFLYHSGTMAYSIVCKECKNKKRRETYKMSPEEKKKVQKQNKKHHEENKNSIEYRTTRAISTYKRLDDQKKFNTNLSRDFVIKALIKPCTYCGYSATGLDRLDNSKGHTEDNCVPCCNECNVARMDNFTHEEMLIIGETIKIVKDCRV